MSACAEVPAGAERAPDGRPLLVGLLLAMGLAACGVEPDANEPAPAAPARAELRNLVLVSIDTLRADRLGVYGYDRDTSPRLDALARHGVRFENAFSVSNWTLPSHMTFFTGLHPASHGTQRFDHRLPNDVPTLAQVLRDFGYRTFGRTTGGFVAPAWGFARGFDSYDARLQGIRMLMDGARSDLERVGADERFFLFVQTFSVHCPYPAPPPLVEQYLTVTGPDAVDPNAYCVKRDHGDVSPATMRSFSDRYDASLRYVDRHLGRFVSWLREAGRLDETVLVFVSDHGEEFGDHGGLFHSHTLYDELLRVPLIILAPGLSPRVVETPVSVVDLMPTLLDLVGVGAEALRAPIDGRSLVPLMRDGRHSAPGPPILAEAHANMHPHLKAIIDGRWKLVLHVESDRVELYDLENDPEERVDLSGRKPQRVAALRARLDSLAPRARLPEEAPAPSDDRRDELRALGYVE